MERCPPSASLLSDMHVRVGMQVPANEQRTCFAVDVLRSAFLTCGVEHMVDFRHPGDCQANPHAVIAASGFQRTMIL